LPLWLHQYECETAFEIPVSRSTTVLDALMYAKEYDDSSLCIRYSCRMASCGSCGMKINGIPRLACYTKVSELKGNTITCDPLSNFPHIRDLVTDFTQFFNHHKDMQPYIQNENTADVIPSTTTFDTSNLSEHLQPPSDVDKYLQFTYCIKCGLCYSACPTVAMDTKFPGPQALAQAYRYTADTRDSTPANHRLGLVDDKHGIWRCHFAGSCSKVCPKGVDPSLGIQLLRSQLLSFSKHQKKIAILKDMTGS
jgi:succinate dehydrogenase / fumarate reductase iron-sulfur subunit